MTRREAPSFRAAPRKTALRTFGRVARAGFVGSAMLLTLGAVGSGCLDRPTAPAEPRTSNTFSERVSLTQIDKIDLLFMIDNSASMADKQKILATAVPDLVGRLVTPDCVQVDTDGKVTARAKSAGGCAAGFSLEFNAIKDIHIGVVTSSMGGHGSDQCNPAADPSRTYNDQAHLLTRGATAKVVSTWDGTSGFFQWDPNGAKTPAGEGNPDTLVKNFADVVQGAGQVGCGFESSLEAWYRFLVDPNPPATVSVLAKEATNLGPAAVDGVDEVLLQQRAEFLRPDSLVAIISLSDENDCSVADGVLPTEVKRFNGTENAAADGWNLADNNGFILNYAATIGSAGGKEFRMKSGSSACANDPSSAECVQCFTNGSAPGCRDLSREEDNLSLRCWDQKRRFGVDMLYPVQRYVDGLREAEVFDLRTADGNTGAALVANPLFQDLPYDLYQSLKTQLADGSISQEDFERRTARLGSDISARGRYAARSTDSVFFAGIVGVPWQDIAVNKDDLSDGYLTADKVDFKNLIPTDGKPPADPYMIEAVKARSGTNPITGEALSLTAGNKVNGHEWNSGEQDLMYACFLPLPEPTDCAGISANCDCSYLSKDAPAADIQAAADAAANPLCQKATGQPYGQTQYHAKAYPGTRFIEVMNRFQSGSILASICTPNSTTPTAADGQPRADYGYRPAVNAIIDRLKSQLTGKCTPRRLAEVDLYDSAGKPVKNAAGEQVKTTPCLIVDAQNVPDEQLGACKACDGIGRLPLETSPNVEALLRRNPDVNDFNCLCQVRQFTGERLDQCKSGSDEVGQGKEGNGTPENDPQGWCYIDNSAAGSGDTNKLTQNCPSHSTIRLATDTNKSTFFITCLGAGLSSGPTGETGAGGDTQLAIGAEIAPRHTQHARPRRRVLSEGAPSSFCRFFLPPAGTAIGLRLSPR